MAALHRGSRRRVALPSFRHCLRPLLASDPQPSPWMAARVRQLRSPAHDITLRHTSFLGITGSLLFAAKCQQPRATTSGEAMKQLG